jgi:hypothetical protein
MNPLALIVQIENCITHAVLLFLLFAGCIMNAQLGSQNKTQWTGTEIAEH